MTEKWFRYQQVNQLANLRTKKKYSIGFSVFSACTFIIWNVFIYELDINQKTDHISDDTQNGNYFTSAHHVKADNFFRRWNRHPAQAGQN